MQRIGPTIDAKKATNNQALQRIESPIDANNATNNQAVQRIEPSIDANTAANMLVVQRMEPAIDAESATNNQAMQRITPSIDAKSATNNPVVQRIGPLIDAKNATNSLKNGGMDVYLMQIVQRIMNYIHQRKGWPNFTWKSEGTLNLLSKVRNLQGRLMGRMEALGFDLRNEALLDTLTMDVIKSSEIEGEILNLDQVRSSIARRLGMEIAGSVESDRHIDGVVEMMVDATRNCFARLTKDRLFDWHAALFPTGRNGMYKIVVGNWRSDTTGPMVVVSGAIGKEKVHFQAPYSDVLEQEMERFLDWFNDAENDLDLVLKAAVAHLWFVTIHPFEDGNGRITRAITDLLLARADLSNQRFYSMSAQIRLERKQYYAVLEATQKGDLDITDWMQWFLQCLVHALESTELVLSKVLFKVDFWKWHAKKTLNARQRKLIDRLLEGFEGKLTSSKWAKIAKCSKDTAVRDINDLVGKAILLKQAGGGRSTSYELNRISPHAS